jgi:NhaP-type Na+/H+ and K+/H+ antiporter
MNLFEINSLAYIFITSVLIVIACKKIRIPAPPVLFLVGMLLPKFQFQGIPFFTISDTVIKAITLIIIPIIIFDIFSRIRHKRIDSLAHHAMQASTFLFPANIILVGTTAYMLFTQILYFKIATMSGFDPIIAAGVISLILIASSDFDIPLKKKTKAQKEFLYQESIMSSALAVLFIFVIISIIEKESILLGGIDIFSGIGVGLIISIIMFKIINMNWKSRLSHYVLLLAGILVYLISDILKANPVIAVASFGFFFGNVTIQSRKQLEEFSSSIVTIFEMIIFIMIPLILDFKLSWQILGLSLLVYIAFITARFFALNIASFHDFNIKERIGLTLYSPKGTITILTLLFLTSAQITIIEAAYPMILTMIIYSLLISTLVSVFWDKITK